MKSPFKFLDAYTRQDRDIFFGREKETDALYDLVNQNRLVLLYGPSGAGKTSLIQCGLSNRFHPTNWFPLFVRRGDNLNTSLRKKLLESLGEESDAHIVTLVEELYEEKLRPVYLVFDQLEEIFILGDEEEGRQFIQDIAALNAAKLPCQVIFSLREEYLAQLYPFEQTIPTLFDRRLRVEPMSASNAGKVVVNSCKRFNIEFEAEEANCQQIIDKVSAGRSGLSLPYLQVYLDRLYREDLVRTYGKNIPDTPYPALKFTAEEIDSLGDIGDVLNLFLKEQVGQIQALLAAQRSDPPEQAVRTVLNSFASLEGTKIPRYRNEIKHQGLGEAGIQLVLDQLVQSRLLREEEGLYELAHDTLSLRISEARSAAEIALLQAAELIQSRMRAFDTTGAWLNEKELQLIENYRAQLQAEEKLSEEGWDFVRNSQIDIHRSKKKQRLIVSGVISVLLTLLGLAGYQWQLANTRLTEMEKAQLGIISREMDKKDQAIYDLKYDEAQVIVLDAFKINTTSLELRDGFLELAYYFNESLQSTRADSLLQYLPAYKSSKIDFPQDSVPNSQLRNEIIRLAGDSLFSTWKTRYYPTMTPVAGGTFWMGDSIETNEFLHQVRLPNFEIGTYELTVWQYDLYLVSTKQNLDSIHATPSWGWHGDNPMIFIAWYDAVAYCNWLSERTGLEPVYSIDKSRQDPNNRNRYDDKNWLVKVDSSAAGYRLPTEAEWEFAAGGGVAGRDSLGHRKHAYAGGSTLDDLAWYVSNSSSVTGVRRALPVGTKLPNELGLYDMSGNVWEWCQDWYGADYYQNSQNAYMPQGPESGNYRVVRGGSWFNSDGYCRVSDRGSGDPYSGSGLGFRVSRRLP